MLIGFVWLPISWQTYFYVFLISPNAKQVKLPSTKGFAFWEIDLLYAFLSNGSMLTILTLTFFFFELEVLFSKEWLKMHTAKNTVN